MNKSLSLSLLLIFSLHPSTLWRQGPFCTKAKSQDSHALDKRKWTITARDRVAQKRGRQRSRVRSFRAGKGTSELDSCEVHWTRVARIIWTWRVRKQKQRGRQKVKWAFKKLLKRCFKQVFAANTNNIQFILTFKKQMFSLCLETAITACQNSRYPLYYVCFQTSRLIY